MKMFIKICSFHIISFVVSIVCISRDKLDIVTSFVTFEERPVSLLTPNLCWNRHELIRLAKTLSESGISMAHSFQQNRTEYYLQHIIVLADLSCPGASTFLTKASEQGYFKSPYRWLLLDDGTRSLDVLEDLEMLVDSDVVVARMGDDTVFVEVYKISANSSVIYNARLSWSPLSRQSINDSESFSNIDKDYNPKNTSMIHMDDSKAMQNLRVRTVKKYGIMEDYRESKVLSTRRMNLRRHTLTMANVITDSNETRKHMSDRLNLHQDSISKMSYMVVHVCFEMLNSTEKLIFTPTWGYRDNNWQGVVGHLLNKEADLGTLTIFTQERVMVIDYIAMVGSTAVRFVFREPPLTYISNIFTLPFSGAVWLAIFICILGCAVFLYITSKWEASMEMHPLQLDGSWADVLILVIGAVLQQGCTLEPRYAAGRCVTLLLFLSLTILYAAYSANIVVLLRAPSSSVRSLPDLLNSPLKFGASDFSYNRYFFKKLNDPIRKAIYDKKIAPKGKKPNFLSMKDGVERIRKGLFAFHMETNPGYRLIQETYQEDEKCDLVELDFINEIEPWVPGQKRSPFRDLFKINFIKIRETGIQACIHHRLHVSKPRCSGSVSTFSSVGITDMYSALLATLYGMLMAPAVLMLEITYKRLVLMKQKRKLMRERFNYLD